MDFPQCLCLGSFYSLFQTEEPSKVREGYGVQGLAVKEFLAQNDLLGSTNNLNYFIMTQHNCLVMSFFLNAYILYLKIKI